MIATVRRRGTVYGGIAAVVPKLYLAYTVWVWVNLFVQGLSLVILVYFWRAVYAERQTIAGLDLRQTLNYILLAQILLPIALQNIIFDFGRLLREGQMAIELLRPVSFRGMFYVRETMFMLLGLVQQLPLFLLAWLVFGLSLPTDPAMWMAFLISLFLGQAALFCFDWLFACLAFYTTEVWGLGIARFGVATFFSGGLLPLDMMPEGQRRLAESLPFAQVIYVPVSLLSGITPLSEAPRLWLLQLAWLAILYVLSGLLFRVAVRTVTVQGG